ncbi:MAG: peptidylprolyl isomerase [Planctomycetota bacterium]
MTATTDGYIRTTASRFIIAGLVAVLLWIASNCQKDVDNGGASSNASPLPGNTPSNQTKVNREDRPVSNLPDGVLARVGAAGDILAERALLVLISTRSDDALNKIAAQKRISAAADAARIEVTASDIARIEQIDETVFRQRLSQRLVYGIDYEGAESRRMTFSDYLNQSFDMTLDEYRTDVASARVRINKLLKIEFPAFSNPTDEALKTFMLEREDYYGKPTRYRCSYITFNVSPVVSPVDRFAANLKPKTMPDGYGGFDGSGIARSPTRALSDADGQTERQDAARLEDALRRALAARARLMTGATWNEIQSAYSEAPSVVKKKNGDIGWFTQTGPFDPAFTDAAVRLGVGDISEPVITYTDEGDRRRPDCVFLIRLTDMDPGSPPDFYALRDRIRTDYINSAPMYLMGQLIERLADRYPLRAFPNAFRFNDGSESDAETVVARVAGQTITRREFYAQLWRSYGQTVVDSLVSNELLYRDFVESGVTFDDRELSRALIIQQEAVTAMELESIKQRQDASSRSDDDTVKMLKGDFWGFVRLRYGLDKDDYINELKRNELISKGLRLKVAITDNEKLQFFYRHLNAYRKPVGYVVKDILIRPSDGGLNEGERPASARSATETEWNAAGSKAVEIYIRLTESPDSYDEIAYQTQYNDYPADVRRLYGLLPTFYKTPSGKFVTDDDYPIDYIIMEAVAGSPARAAELSPGMISGPLRGAQGFHIVKFERVIEPEMPSLDNPTINAEVMNDLVAERLAPYVNMRIAELLRTMPVQENHALLDTIKRDPYQLWKR